MRATPRPRLSEGRVLRDENDFRIMDTEWHRITCFNGLGKTIAEHCEKGMKVLVHGRIDGDGGAPDISIHNTLPSKVKI